MHVKPFSYLNTDLQKVIKITITLTQHKLYLQHKYCAEYTRIKLKSTPPNPENTSRQKTRLKTKKSQKREKKKKRKKTKSKKIQFPF